MQRKIPRYVSDRFSEFFDGVLVEGGDVCYECLGKIVQGFVWVETLCKGFLVEGP